MNAVLVRDCGLWTVDCGVRCTGQGLWTVDCGLRSKGGRISEGPAKTQGHGRERELPEMAMRGWRRCGDWFERCKDKIPCALGLGLPRGSPSYPSGTVIYPTRPLAGVSTAV